MKKILFFIIAILFSINVGATKKYVTTTGVDDAGRDGSISQPWALPSYAATRAVSGDTIMVGSGEFDEGINEITLPVGVSLMGVINATDTTHIISTRNVAGRSTIVATYWGSPINGNQSISYIKLTGSNYTARIGISIYERNNVSVHHCILEEFLLQGISFSKYLSDGQLSVTYCMNNKCYNNIITNCAGVLTNQTAGIEINGQDGMLVEYNIITQTKALASSGVPIKGVPGINRNLTIRYNEIYQPAYDVTGLFDFSIELWDYRGNVEIYDNYCEGSIDIGGRYNYASVGSYSAWIHDNVMGQVAQSLSEATRGFVIEGHKRNEDIIIERNYIKNTCQGIGIGVPNSYPDLTTTYKNIRISYNIFESLGLADSRTTNSKGWGITWMIYDVRQTVDNFQVYNNIFTAKVGTYSTSYGIGIPDVPSTNVKYRNNIILNFDYAPIYWQTNADPAVLDPLITCDILSIEKNIFYGNGNSNAPRYAAGALPTNATYDNIIADPLFIGTGTPPENYKLQDGSPAKDAGYLVNLTSDYGGYSVPIGALPDIGVWEYGADVDPPNWTEQGIGWDRMQKKVNFRDTVNFTRGFMIAGVPISSSGSGLEILGGLEASVDDLNATAGATGNFQGQINAIKASTVDDSKADTSLSNLSSVAINTHLLPGTDGAVNLGSATYKWGNIFIDSAKVINWNNGDITATHSDQTLTFAGGNIVLPSTTSIGSVSSTEIGYVNNVTSAIQTQLNSAETRIDSIVTVLADTVNIETLLQIDFDTDTVASLSDVRSLAGSGVVGVTLNSGTLTLTGSDATADDITFYTNGDGQYNLPAGGGNLTIMSQVQGWINDSLDKAKVDIRKFDSDTIPLFVFGLGSGHSTDTALFNNGRIAGAFYNSGSDTLYVTELRGVLVEGTGTETIDVQVSWHANMRDVSAVNLNTSAITINNMTTGTSDVSFNNNGIPPGRWIWCVLSGASSGNKPTALMLTMTGYRRNRSY